MMHARQDAFHVTPKERQPPIEPHFLARAATWLAAIALTATLHGGIFYLATSQQKPVPPVAVQEPAAVMITMAPIAMSIRSETDNTAEGPESAEREASEETAVDPTPPPPTPVPLSQPIPEVPPPPLSGKPVAELPPPPPEKADLPVKKPDAPTLETRVAELPKAEVPRPMKKPKPRDKPPEKAKPAKTEQKKQLATKKGGGPKSETATGEKTTAQADGGSSVGSAKLASWKAKVRGKILRAKRYPPDARRKKEQGAASLRVTIASSGAVTAVTLVTSSGSDSLDKEAVAVMRRASPFAPPPDGRPTTMTIPLNFTLR